jgi:hypothetical protein
MVVVDITSFLKHTAQPMRWVGRGRISPDFDSFRPRPRHTRRRHHVAATQNKCSAVFLALEDLLQER